MNNKSVSETIVKVLEKNINDEIAEIDNSYYEIKRINDFAEEIEETTEIWNTSGGIETVHQTTNNAKKLETNKLTTGLSNLAKEIASYTIKTVIDETTTSKIND